MSIAGLSSAHSTLHSKQLPLPETSVFQITTSRYSNVMSEINAIIVQIPCGNKSVALWPIAQAFRMRTSIIKFSEFRFLQTHKCGAKYFSMPQ